ncbi:MAG: creatininase family protein [Anderseniella sp.]
MKPQTFWNDMSIDDIRGADTEHWIGVLPVAATEQHGKHLPASTDADIARAMINRTVEHLPDDLSVTFLPVQAVGASAEHGQSRGTISREPCDLAQEWFEMARELAAAGIRKLVLVSSHGGNTPVCDMVILRARIELGMLAVATSWSRFGYPTGLFSADEIAFGIHGGDIETSIMLATNPGLVDMTRAENSPSLQQSLVDSMTHLRAYGPHRFGWMMNDLNASGVVGNASAATAEKGAATLDHQASGFIELLRDVQRFDTGIFRR